MKALLVIGIVVALAPALNAQDGLRSASLPERPIATQPPGPEDLFRAGPDTYRPGRPPRPRPGEVSSGWSFWPYASVPAIETPIVRREPSMEGGFLQMHLAPANAVVYVDGLYEGTATDLRSSSSRLRPGVHRVRIEAAGYQTYTFDTRIVNGETVTLRQELVRASAAGPSVSAPASVAKTMYVIPRCYAGDKPPDASTGCDLTKLRTIR